MCGGRDGIRGAVVVSTGAGVVAGTASSEGVRELVDRASEAAGAGGSFFFRFDFGTGTEGGGGGGGCEPSNDGKEEGEAGEASGVEGGRGVAGVEG